MDTFVLDTSVLIDLEKCGVLDAVFSLPLRIVAELVMFENEFLEFGEERLVELELLGLSVEELDGEGTALAMQYRERVPAFSIPDAFSMALAKTQGYGILVGAMDMRTLAKDEDISFHGVIWILDHLLSQGHIGPDQYCLALSILRDDPECWLPAREISIRINEQCKE